MIMRDELGRKMKNKIEKGHIKLIDYIVRDANNSPKNVRLSLDSQGVKRGNLNVLDYKGSRLWDKKVG